MFSPTGGTEKVAEIVARNISKDVTNINLCDSDFNFENVEIEENDMIVIAMPSYGGRCPSPAVERHRKTKTN